MSERAEIFKPNGKSAYERHGEGGTSSARPRQAPAPAPKPAAAAPAAKAATTAAPPPTEGSSAKAQGQALAETVVGAMVDRMAALAQSKGGTLTIADIQNMGTEFQQQTSALSTVFEQTLTQTARAASGQSWDQVRKAPFDRIIVKTFSHMFADGTQLRDQKKGLSRRMLPGFFMALNMMLGEENVRALQDKCRDILDTLRQTKDGDFQWDYFYENTEARALVVDAMITMALHFENLGRREAWFLDLVNSHLGPADDPGSPAAHWQLTAPAFYRLLNAMFDCLKKELKGDGRAAILDRHGNEKIAKLDGVLTIISSREQS